MHGKLITSDILTETRLKIQVFRDARCCVFMQVVPKISCNCSAVIFRFKESIKRMLYPEHKGTTIL